MAEETLDTGGDLRTYLRILNRRKLVIIATALVVVALSLAYALVKHPVYTASASVLVPQQSATSALAPSDDQQAPAAVNLQRTLSDDQAFAQGNAVKRAAQRTLGSTAKVSVGASTTADVLTFTASDGNAAQAAAIANTYAKAYIDQQRANQVGQYTSEVAALQSSIASIKAKAAQATGTASAADQDTIASLTQSLQDLQAASNLVNGNSGTVVKAATTPTSPSSPQPARDGILALVIGLVVGVGLAFAVDRLDDTIKSFDDIEAYSGNLPVLGTIPLVDGWRRREQQAHLALAEDSTSPVSEAYRTLRTAVQFLSLDEPKHVIGITSAVPDEGKSTTVANLAQSFAQAEHRTVVVSFDFRKPRLHLFFKLDNTRGVTSVLLGQDSLRNTLQTVAGEPYLRVLPAGPIPPNPAEILSLDRVVELVDAVSKTADIVLVDCPPVLPVTDTLLISRLVDGMLVLTRAGSTKKQDLQRTIELLQQVKTPVLGTIVNSVPHRGAYAYNYGYGYGYGYGYRSPAALEDHGEIPSPARSDAAPFTPSQRYDQDRPTIVTSVAGVALPIAERLRIANARNGDLASPPTDNEPIPTREP